jgi:hypothetical protein
MQQRDGGGGYRQHLHVLYITAESWCQLHLQAEWAALRWRTSTIA